MVDARKLKVVQWATGNIGTRSLQAVMAHPAMELVGVYVYNPEKVDVDAGVLAGGEPVGICASNSLDDIVALNADCVLYMCQGCDYDEVCGLLASGKNIVTTRGEFHHPASMENSVRDRIERACAAGRSSIYSTGSSPGFATEALAIPLIAEQRRLDCLLIDEYADMSRRDSPNLIFNIMGYGTAWEAFDQQRLAHVRSDFAASLAQVADAIKLSFDAVTVAGETAAASEDTQIAAGQIKAGTVAAQRITVSGMRNGSALMKFRANWYCTTNINKDWDLQDTGWRIQVDGDTPMDVRFRFPIAIDDYPKVMPGLTAHRAVNAVAAVCAAAPGIRTTVDLPQVIARF